MKAGSAIAPAAVLLVLGAWFSLESFSPSWFEAEQFWPLLIAASGLCFVLGYLFGGGPWQLFLGLTAAGGGAVAFAFTGGVLEWALLPRLWPLFLVVLGISGLAYLVASRDIAWPALVMALGTLTIGCTGLLHGLGLVQQGLLGQLRALWPALLMLTGLTGLLQALWHAVTGR